MVFDAYEAGGFMNPTLAWEIYFWGMATYTNYNNADDHTSEYKLLHMGRYIWLYVIAPYVAAIFAGFFAKLNYNHLTGEGSEEKTHVLPEA